MERTLSFYVTVVIVVEISSVCVGAKENRLGRRTVPATEINCSCILLGIKRDREKEKEKEREKRENNFS
jgi:hypothetical protein